MIVTARLRASSVNRASSTAQERTLDVASRAGAFVQILQSRGIRAYLGVHARLLFGRKRSFNDIQNPEDLHGANINSEVAAPRAAGTAGQRADVRRGSNPRVVAVLRPFECLRYTHGANFGAGTRVLLREDAPD